MYATFVCFANSVCLGSYEENERYRLCVYVCISWIASAFARVTVQLERKREREREREGGRKS